jgi:hypothetical protein
MLVLPGRALRLIADSVSVNRRHRRTGHRAQNAKF